MAARRRVIELAFTEEELAYLERVSRSRTEPLSHVERAHILLAYHATPSLYATGRAIGVTHQTVERCLRRAQDLGVKAALDDRPRPGRERTISSEARTFVVYLACLKPKDLDYPHEVWTTRLLAAHVRERGPEVGHACLAHLSQGTLCKILAAHEIKPHKVKYYLQNRDPEFAEKMAEVLDVYREVETLKEAAREQDKEAPSVAIISCDEKPGIQALATTTPDLPPRPTVHEAFARDQEYVRLGTMSLLAGLDLVTGVVHARVEERHRSREFVDLLKQIDAAHAPTTAIKLLVDNHSAHKSKETRAWLGKQPKGRFAFTFLPKHGSWLNLIEGFFSKLARSVLRHIRVADKQELKRRILAQIDRINRNPVVHTWTYKLKEVA